MKALVYQQAHPIGAFAIEEREVAEPALRETDILVDIRAVGLNPGEALIRSVRSAAPGHSVILGWEFAGVVRQVGPKVEGFAIGDRVMGTGDVSRAGCWAERLAVDHRVVAKIPDSLAFCNAASVPIGGLTAWESIFRNQNDLPPDVDRILVIGGAGGVGSMAIQLLKQRTKATAIATASRPESQQWCDRMGADLVIDHSRDVVAQLEANGIEQVDMVFSTAGTSGHLSWIAEILRPFGHLSATDFAPPFDVSPIVSKSISLHTEMVFAKIIGGFDPASQGRMLAEIAERLVSGGLRPIVTTRLDGLTAGNMRKAHELLETRRTIGKIVIDTRS
jgi:NADPH:quinone reductase